MAKDKSEKGAVKGADKKSGKEPKEGKVTVKSLLEELREAHENKDAGEARRIRAKLRSLGHKGGLGERKAKDEDDEETPKKKTKKVKKKEEEEDDEDEDEDIDEDDDAGDDEDEDDDD